MGCRAMTPSCSPSAFVIRCLAPALLAPLFIASGGDAVAIDWSGVEVAWRNDPRPPSDAPLQAEPQPRRMSRRAQRRLQRRDTEIEEPVARDVEAPRRQLIHRDQPYGDHPKQRLDLYLPEGCGGGLVPMVVWIHGPDWKSGTKGECPVSWLVDEGYVVASIDYRTSDVATFPAQLDDCRAAIDSLAGDAATWGIDADRVAVMGSGAGGHLAALVAMAKEPSAPIRETSTDDISDLPHATPAAIIAIDAPTDLPSLGASHDRAGSAASRLVGGPLPEVREAAQRASPTYHASSDDPPALLVHHTRSTMPLDQSRRLEASLDALGVDATLVVIDGLDGDSTLSHDSSVGTTVVEFLARSLGSGGSRDD